MLQNNSPHNLGKPIPTTQYLTVQSNNAHNKHGVIQPPFQEVLARLVHLLSPPIEQTNKPLLTSHYSLKLDPRNGCTLLLHVTKNPAKKEKRNNKILKSHAKINSQK
jgi:hypothetical protein